MDEKKKSLLQKVKKGAKSLAVNFGFSFVVSWKASKKYLILRIGIEILSALQPTVMIFISKEVINLLSDLAKGGSTDEGISRFISILVLVLVVQVVGILINKTKEITSGIHKDLIGNYINLQTARKTMSLDISFFDSPKFHNELLNAGRDSTALQTLTWFSIDIIRSCIQLGVSAIILVSLNWIFALALVIMSIPTVFIERRFTALTYNWTRNRAPEERKMGYIRGILTGGGSIARESRLYGYQDEMIGRYTSLWKKWFKEKKNITLKKSIWVTLASLIPKIGVIGITAIVGLRIISGNLTIGDYSLYTGITGQLIGSLFTLITSFTQIYDNDMRITNYRSFLSWKPILLPSGDRSPSQMPCIEFRNVSFKYPNTENYVLKNVSFIIQPGEKIALVGLNGAGKTTIIKLVLRFYDCTEGEILFDGIDIKEYEIMKLRRLFAVLFQDYANYAFTAREGIAMSDLDNIGDDGRINDACMMSEADKVISKWEDGLDTFMTRGFEENGVELSGGEWQKIALARAFFRDADIIILDEPTSSLDPEAEHKIFKRIAELCKGKGSIFISHRLSNVTMADRILVLEDGKIVEDGSHGELLAIAGRYSYLFNLQAEKYMTANDDERATVNR